VEIELHVTNAPADDAMLVYRMDVTEPLSEPPLSKGEFVFVRGITGISANFMAWGRTLGWPGAVKTALKVLSGKRLFFGVKSGNSMVQSGWANIGFCRHYVIESDSIVLGELWTAPEHRGKGLASVALRRVIVRLHDCGFKRFYIDTKLDNPASQRMIEKAGFSNRIQ